MAARIAISIFVAISIVGSALVFKNVTSVTPLTNTLRKDETIKNNDTDNSLMLDIPRGFSFFDESIFSNVDRKRFGNYSLLFPEFPLPTLPRPTSTIRQVTLEEYQQNKDLIKYFYSLPQQGQPKALTSKEAQNILLPPSVRGNLEKTWRNAGYLDGLDNSVANFDTLEGYQKIWEHVLSIWTSQGFLSEHDADHVRDGFAILNTDFRKQNSEDIVNSPESMQFIQDYEAGKIKPVSLTPIKYYAMKNNYSFLGQHNVIARELKNLRILNELASIPIAQAHPAAGIKGGEDCKREGTPDRKTGSSWTTLKCKECVICATIAYVRICVYNSCGFSCLAGGSEAYLWDDKTFTCGCSGPVFLPAPGPCDNQVQDSG